MRLHANMGIVLLALSRSCTWMQVPACAQTELPVVPVYRAARATLDIRIDGVLGELDWTIAERIALVKFRHEPEDGRPLRHPTYVAALWDDRNLYLGITVTDREIWAALTQRDARLFPEECVEFFIDPDGDSRRYIETQINSAGNIRDLLVTYSSPRPTLAEFDVMAKWDYSNLRKAVLIHQDAAGRYAGWTLEVAIPWTELAFSRRSWPPRPGEELRINLYRYERDRGGNLPLELSGWSKVRDSFHEPARFGRFVFAGQAVSPQ